MLPAEGVDHRAIHAPRQFLSDAGTESVYTAEDSISVSKVNGQSVETFSRNPSIAASGPVAVKGDTVVNSNLPVKDLHTFALETLSRPDDAPRHKDPFDRLLIAQAKAEEMLVLTHDSLIPFYNEPFIIKV